MKRRLSRVRQFFWHGLYRFGGYTYHFDDFGSLNQVSFEQLSLIDVYRNQEH